MSLLRKSQKSTKRDSAEHLENNNSLTQGSELPRNEKRFRGKTRTQDLTKTYHSFNSFFRDTAIVYECCSTALFYGRSIFCK